MKTQGPRNQNEVFGVGPDEPIYTSGVVSRLLKIPVWVLKQLDRENVVKPPRKNGRSRLYSANELNRLHYVWYFMNERGLNIEGVKVLLERDGVEGTPQNGNGRKAAKSSGKKAK